MDKEKLIEVQHVSRVFRDGSSEVTALRDADFSLNKGEFAALMGKSGSGKTTLLNILSTSDSATSGRYLFEGQDITGLSEKERITYRRGKIAVIYQQYNLIPELTVRENILLPFIIANRKAEHGEVENLAEWLEISGRLDFFPAKLSGGEKQRVAIARALITKPALLLADEPTGNLDSVNGKTVIKLLSDCARKRGQTILMVTHDAEAAGYAERQLTISDGVVKDGSKKLEESK